MTIPSYVAFAFDGGSTSLDVPYYSGFQADDIAFIWAFANDTPTFGTVSGWTALTQVNNGTFGGRLYWKRLTGSESGTVTVSASGAVSALGIMIGVRNALTSGTPYEGANSANGSGTSQTSATIITTSDDCLGLRFGGSGVASASSPPSGWIERVDTNSGFNVQIDTIDLASAGTEAASTRTISSASWVVQTLAVLPIPAASGLHRMFMVF